MGFASLADASKLINGSTPLGPVVQVLCNLVFFVLVLGLSEFDYRCIKRDFSTPSSSIVFLDIVPIGFLSQLFESSSLLSRI